MSFLAKLIPKNLLALRRTTDGQRGAAFGRTPFDFTQAGSLITPDTAMTLSAVWRCTNYLSQQIATLPWNIRVGSLTPAGARQSRLMPDHPVAKVLRTSANPEMSAFTFREHMYAAAINWGNGYAEIERDAAGRVKNLWFISPDRVDVQRDPETGGVVYTVSQGRSGQNVFLFPDEILHLHGLGFDGLVGYSTIAYAARTMGLNMSLEDHGSSLFGNGATPSGVLTHPGKLNKPARERLRESWNEFLKGPKKTLKTVVLDEGLTWSPTSLPNDAAQFLETRKFSVIDICRWYGVPPNKVFDWDKSTYNNFEQANREVIRDTLLPWILRFEQEIDRKLLGNNYGGMYSKMEVQELLRGDPDSRSAYYMNLFRVAAISPNEIREKEGMNPIEGGDRYFIQANNLVPLDRIDDVDRLSQGTQPQKKDTTDTEDTPEDDTEDTKEQARAIDLINAWIQGDDDAEPVDPLIAALLQHEGTHGG